MPTFQTDISTAQALAATNFSQRINDSRRVDGPLEWLDSIYTIANPTTETAADIIILGKIPIGAIVYPEHSFLFNETDPGTTLTLDIGDSVDGDRYADGIAAAASAGIIQFTSAVANVDGVVNRHKVTEVTCELRATIAAAVSALSAGAKIHFKVAYKCLGT